MYWYLSTTPPRIRHHKGMDCNSRFGWHWVMLPEYYQIGTCHQSGLKTCLYMDILPNERPYIILRYIIGSWTKMRAFHAAKAVLLPYLECQQSGLIACLYMNILPNKGTYSVFGCCRQLHSNPYHFFVDMSFDEWHHALVIGNAPELLVK